MFTINFNNGNSFYDLGLIIERRPIVPIPKKRTTQIPVPGRNGTLTEEDGTYDNIEIPIEFAFVEKKDFYAKVTTVKKWLIGDILDYRLMLSDNVGYHYKVKSIELDDIERFLIVAGRFTAKFICDPFIYSNDEDSIPITTPTILFNPGVYESEPYIKVKGTGDVSITINNQTVTLTGLTDYIEMDSTLEECYRDTLPLNTKMNGEFLKLQPGDNLISWTGNVSGLDVRPNWRWF